jgi:hypothetical protein
VDGAMQKPMERLLTMVQYGIENGERRKSTANVLTVLGCANARYLKDNDGAESEYSLLLQYQDLLKICHCNLREKVKVRLIQSKYIISDACQRT